MRALGRKKHMFFLFGNARPKSNACAHLKQRKKHSGLMIDLQKAFDTVDHGILLHKLKALGFHDLSVSWLESYLTNRNQKTEINGILFLIPVWFLAEYRRD